mgnify:CR=1 FL=1
MGGRLAPEWVAGINRNGWPGSSGIAGRNRAEYARSRHKQLYDGKLDDKLVYKKGISKRLEEYTKNVPPHVRAARMLDQLDGRIVSYVMTTAGPEPVQKRSSAAYDYGHYSEKQLAPVADMVLRFFDLDYRSLILGGKQLNLFKNL